MVLTIIPLGGVGEVGRNSVALDIDGKIIVLDMGFHLERFIEVTGNDYPSERNLLRRLLGAKALPNIRFLSRRKKDILAVVCSHAHLDHVGAIPYLIKKLNCPVYATPFTSNVIYSLCKDTGATPKIIEKQSGSSFTIGNFKIDFIPVAHSTPESVAVAIHTSYGVILYANDYKNDQETPFEFPTDINKLKSLKGKVKLLLLDSLYAPKNEVCLSEKHAMNEVLSLKNEIINSRAIVASTFSSHIFRLNSLCDLADSLGREIVFIGRSLSKYIGAAKHIIDLSKRGKILRFRSQANSFFMKMGDPKKYFMITTGHQGEPEAVLNRMAEGAFDFTSDDTVIFSCTVIPTEINQRNREELEGKLEAKKVNMVRDIHVSGHAFAKDHLDLLNWLKPEFLLPLHGEPFMTKAMENLAKDKVDTILRLRVNEKYSILNTEENN